MQFNTSREFSLFSELITFRNIPLYLVYTSFRRWNKLIRCQHHNALEWFFFFRILDVNSERSFQNTNLNSSFSLHRGGSSQFTHCSNTNNKLIDYIIVFFFVLTTQNLIKNCPCLFITTNIYLT